MTCSVKKENTCLDPFCILSFWDPIVLLLIVKLHLEKSIWIILLMGFGDHHSAHWCMKWSCRKDCQGLWTFPGWEIRLAWRIYCHEEVYFNNWWSIFESVYIFFPYHSHIDVIYILSLFDHHHHYDFSFITFFLLFWMFQIPVHAPYIRWKC